MKYAYDAGKPGSGWKTEGGFAPTDSTRAVLRFLTVGNQLYMAASIPDSSVGGSNAFNFFDGLLMSLKNHNTTERPGPTSEYFYSWWHPNLTQHKAKGLPPGFVGTWGAHPIDSLRTPTEIANWDAVTVVNRGKVVLSGSIADLKKEDLRVYDIRIDGDRERFLGTVAARGWVCEEADRGVIRVQLPEGATTRSIFEIARELGVRLRHFHFKRDSLEDIFVNSLRESEAGATDARP